MEGKILGDSAALGIGDLKRKTKAALEGTCGGPIQKRLGCIEGEPRRHASTQYPSIRGNSSGSRELHRIGNSNLGVRERFRGNDGWVCVQRSRKNNCK